MKCGLIIGAIVVVAAVLLFSLFSSSSTRRAAHIISFSQFMTELSSGHVRSATLQGPKIYVVFTDGRAGETYTPIVPTLVQRLLEKGVEVTAVPAEEPTPIALAVSWLPFLILVGIMLAFGRNIRRTSVGMVDQQTRELKRTNELLEQVLTGRPQGSNVPGQP